MLENPPVITIDGPSGSGKGTLSYKLAKELGWHFLDSGAIYRVLAVAALKHQVPLNDLKLNTPQLVRMAMQLDVSFDAQSQKIVLEGQEITQLIRTEQCGGVASQIAQFPGVRAALLERQRAFLMPPGLVADGRDMGTVVFPDAVLKIFLEASPLERAKRRQSQLKEQGINVSLDGLFAEIAERDLRDRSRPVAPLVPAQDAIVMDTTALSILEVFALVMAEVNNRKLRA